MKRFPKSQIPRLLLAVALVLAGATVATTTSQENPPSPLTDTDNDGIPDDWEINGVPVTYPDGTQRRLEIKNIGADSSEPPPVGASPFHQDVFVWIGWMESPPYTHKPRKNRNGLDNYALERVVRAFRNSPIDNRDGNGGINLHLMYATKALQHVDLFGDSTDGVYNWQDFDDAKTSIFPLPPADHAGVFHYVLFVHELNLPDPDGGTCLSGLSRDIPSSDFIVALGCSEDDTRDPEAQGNSEAQSGTFMHELGHNLGLRHGGSDGTSYKPNYISVMNYLFQLSGIFRDKQPGQFDYSEFNISLDENNLSPKGGISSRADLKGYGSAHLCGAGQPPLPILSLADPVRWDCTDQPPEDSAIPFDVTFDGCFQMLAGQEDWKKIVLTGPAQPSTGDCLPGANATGRELDSRLSALAPIFPVQRVRAVPAANGIQVTWDRIRLDSVVSYEVFRQRVGGTGLVSRLAQTRLNSFLDRSALPGVTYVYRVGSVGDLPNLGVLNWIRGNPAVQQVIDRLAIDLGRTRFHMPALSKAIRNLSEPQDLSFRTPRSGPVTATRPAH
jgi:hypothetical protein